MVIIKILFFPFLLFSSLFSEQGSFLEKSFKDNESIVTFQCRIKRIQVFKDYTRVSAGKLFFKRDCAMVYSYKSPSEFKIFLQGGIQNSIDTERSLGVRKKTDKLNSLAFLLQSGECEKSSFKFRGSIDNRLIYSCSDLNLYAAFNRRDGRVQVLEKFDNSNKLKEQITFNYNPEKESGSIPVSIVSRTVIGGKILVDSTVISKVKINSDISYKVFKIPESIKWLDSDSLDNFDKISDG